MFFNSTLPIIFVMLILSCIPKRAISSGVRSLSMKKKNAPASIHGIYTDNINKRLIPKTPNQILYSKALANKNNHLIVVNGPAGSGKTHFVCDSAIANLISGTIDKIIVTRPTISVDNEELGYLPGTVNRKMNPWMKPIFDVFLNYYNQRDLERMILDDIVEVVPIAHMRGRTFKRSYIIADEMQNSSPIQMKMLLTRIGEGSKMVITGDLSQTDLKRKTNGFFEFMNKYHAYVRHKSADQLSMVELTQDDVFRSEIVKTVLNIYDFDEEEQVINVAENIDALDSQSWSVDVNENTDCCDKEENSYECFEDDLHAKQRAINRKYIGDAAMIPKKHISKRLKRTWEEDGSN